MKIMLFQIVADYLLRKLRFACEIIAALLFFAVMVFGLNIFAAIFDVTK